MEFSNFLTLVAKEVNQQLQDYYQAWQSEANSVHPRLLPLVDVCIKANLGGKRLRAALVKLGFELAGGKDNSEILKVAAAFEIFQTAILIHDDIIDQSLLRRGVPTVYQVLGGDHLAISEAICLGDIGFFQALQVIVESEFPSQKKNLALASFNRSMMETATGEMLDVELSRPGITKTEADALQIFQLKTSRYTIIGPMELGAILAGGNPKLLKSIKKFGENLGIAFQIQDDILGVFGDEKTLGKSVTSDVEEGKNTLLITYALDHATPEQKKLLEAHYGQGKVDLKTHQLIKQVFESCGALEYSRAQALKYVDQAKKVIPQLTKDQAQKALLVGLSDFLISRQK